MEIIETPIKDLVIIKPRVFEDARGFFCETYNEERYQAAGIKQHFVQDNQSKSSYGVVRGLHFQLAPYSQAKLVSVSIGLCGMWRSICVVTHRLLDNGMA